jgi:hypothetical protein
MNKTIFFAALSLASSAAAQTMDVVAPRGVVNTGIVIVREITAPRVELGAMLVSPVLTPAFKPMPMGPSLPVLPVVPVIPGTPVMPIINPANPIPYVPRRSVTPVVAAGHAPALNVLLSAPSKESNPAKDAIASREKLDGIFDGRKQPAVRPDEDERGPVRTGRHVSLPENDLEREIGAY